MPRLSKLLEKLEDTVEARWGVWFQRHKKKLPLYIPVGLVCWYFYGMLLNSMRLGIDAVFHIRSARCLPPRAGTGLRSDGLRRRCGSAQDFCEGGAVRSL